MKFNLFKLYNIFCERHFKNKSDLKVFLQVYTSNMSLTEGRIYSLTTNRQLFCSLHLVRGFLARGSKYLGVFGINKFENLVIQQESGICYSGIWLVDHSVSQWWNVSNSMSCLLNCCIKVTSHSQLKLLWIVAICRSDHTFCMCKCFSGVFWEYFMITGQKCWWSYAVGGVGSLYFCPVTPVNQ